MRLLALSGCVVVLGIGCAAQVEGAPVDASPAGKTLVLFDGNSLTAGNGSTPGHSYPDDVAAELGPSFDYLNVGVGGQTTREMLADVETEVDAKHPSVVVAWEIGNALYYWQAGSPRGQEPDVAYSDFVAYCRGRRAAGARVIALTVTPRSADHVDQTWVTAVDKINNAMRLDWREYADGLADVAADPGLQDPSKFPDGVHLDDGEYAAAARVVASTLRGLP